MTDPGPPGEGSTVGGSSIVGSGGSGSGGGGAGRVGRLLRTLSHLPAGQVLVRAEFLLRRRIYASVPTLPIRRARSAVGHVQLSDPLPAVPRDVCLPAAADGVERRAEQFERGVFEYLHRRVEFGGLDVGPGVDWDAPGQSPLWTYQLHYLGAVLDLAATGRAGAARALTESWIASRGECWDKVAWHSYPVSLRLVNLCLAATQLGSFAELGPQAAPQVALHAAYLLAHVEHDVRGNHLLENARALLFAGRFLRGQLAERCDAAGRWILERELDEQVLPDGGHFELAPLYHGIVLHRLAELAVLLGPTDGLHRALVRAVSRMADYLASVLCPDDDIPLLGDSARGFGPPPRELLALAARVTGHEPRPPRDGLHSLRSTGLHVFRAPALWAVLDAGQVCPVYLPAHGQADALTVEVWVDGAPVVVDPGVYDYTGPERAWGRSSRAHSTVTVDDADDSEVYASFRVGGRAHVTVDVDADQTQVNAYLTPWDQRARISRSARLTSGDSSRLRIEDSAELRPGSVARSRLHLHEDVVIVSGAGTSEIVLRTGRGEVTVRAAHALQVEAGRRAPEFGRCVDTQLLVQVLREPTIEAGDHATGAADAAPRSVRGWFEIERREGTTA